MPTSKSAIKAEILSFIQTLNSGDVTKKTKAQVESEFADKLATVIQNAIRSATVQPGIPVTTAGSALAQTGATTGPGTLL